MKISKKIGTSIAAALTLTGTVSMASSVSASAATTRTDGIPSGIHLKVWSWWGKPEVTVVQQLANAWGKAHGDTVTVIAVPFNTNFANAVRAGKGPDIGFAMAHDGNGVYHQEGLLAPVTVDTKLYNPLTVKAVTFDGKQWAYPISVQSIALFYNKKLIPTPPKTWAEFVADANKYGFAYDRTNLYFDFAYIGGLGGYVFKDNNGTLDAKDIGLDNAGAVQAYTLLHDMDTKYHWMTSSMTSAIAGSEFQDGKIGMILDGPWDTSNMLKAKVDLGVARIPNLPNGKPATPFLGVSTAVVNALGHNVPAAESLAEYLSTAGQMQYFRVNQDSPALLAIQKNKEVQSNVLQAGFISALKYAIPTPNIPQMSSVWTASIIMANIVKGSTTPLAGATQFVKNINTAISIQQN